MSKAIISSQRVSGGKLRIAANACFMVAFFLLIFSLAILIHPFFWLVGAFGYGYLVIHSYRRKKKAG